MIKRASCLAGVLAMALPALGVQPATWSHSTEADFAAGKLDKTVTTSLGEVLLARATEELLEPREDVGVVSAVAVDQRGRVVLACSPGGKVYRLERKKLVELAELPGVLVRHLAFEGDDLVAGTCGKGAGLYRIDPKGKVAPIWTDKEVTTVWAVAPAPRGSYYVATGAEGKVYHVQPNGKAAVIYDSEDKNVLSLAVGPAGRLYAGTGENGLIIEIEPARKRGRVLYDAAEAEISVILAAPDGAVYAATSDTTKAGVSGEAPSAQEKGAPAPGTTPGPPTRPSTSTAPASGGGARPATPGQPAPGQKPPAEPPAADPAKAAARSAKPVTTQPEPTTAPGSDGGDLPFAESVVEEIRAMGARTAGAPGAGPRQVPIRTTRPMPPTRPVRPARPPTPGVGKGNAVYRIDTEGFVRAVFRRPVAIMAMVLHEGVLMLGTGHGGQVFSVDVDAGRVSMVVKLDPKDVTALVVDGGGKLYAGTADKAAVYSVGTALAKKGTLVSKALDAKQIAAWGTAEVRAAVPAGCKATLAIRSGNVAKPDDKTWSSWSRETAVGGSWVKLSGKPGRFLQYRLTLSGNGKATPAVEQVRLVYQVKNLPPVVAAVSVKPSGPPDRQRQKGDGTLNYRMVQIQAADPNGDPLRFAVYFRRRGHQRWIELTDKLTKPLYPWDTTGVADGVYEVRVVASDDPANPPGSALDDGRISRAVVVDNTAPTVAGLTAKAGKGKASLSGTVTDAGSRVVRIEYSVDTNDEWIAVLPADGICDSGKEALSVDVPDLEAGAHRLAVRVVDEYKNTGYGSVEVTVEK